MRLLVLGFALAFASFAHADLLPRPQTDVVPAVTYDYKDCTMLESGFGELLDRAVCVQKVRCTKFAVNGPKSEVTIEGAAYCNLGTDNRCPEATDCTRSKSVTEKDQKSVTVLKSANPSIARCPVVADDDGDAPPRPRADGAAPPGAAAAREAAAHRSQMQIPAKPPGAQ